MDDGTKNRQNQGRLFGKIAFTSVYIIIAFFSIFTDKEINAGATAMFLAFYTGELFSEWKDSRKKMHLFLVIAGIISITVALIISIYDMFGIAI